MIVLIIVIFVAVSVNIQELQLTCMVQQNVGINFIRWTFYPSDGSPHFDIKFGSGSRYILCTFTYIHNIYTEHPPEKGREGGREVHWRLDCLFVCSIHCIHVYTLRLVLFKI